MAKRGSRATAATAAPGRSHAPGLLDGLLRWLATPSGFAAAAVALVLLALLARLATWEWIFGSGRVELLPADSHYYVRLARLHLDAGRPVRFDPFVGFPFGSENYWPPLHTLLVTLLAAARPDPELGVAFTGPLATVVWLGVIAWVARRAIGPRAALAALYVLALTPIAVEAGKIGNADHNVHEAPLATLTLLLTIAATRGSTRAAVASGLIAGAARLLTTTGFVLPAVVAVAYLLTALGSGPEDRVGLSRRIALAGAACVATLLLAVFALGYPGRLDYEALTLFHPLLACGAFGVAVAVGAWMEDRRRAAALGAACALAWVALVPQLLRAAGHLARRDPLLAAVAESRPLVGDPVLALALLGPVLLALPFAFVGAARPLLRRRAPELAGPVVAGLLFLAAAASQARFGPFLCGAAAVLIPVGLGRALGALRPAGARWAGGLTALAFGTLLVMLIPPAPPGTPARAAVIRPTLIWMRDHLPPASADPWSDRSTPSYGVLAPYDYGHFITLYAERPALASTFSQTDAHVAANRTASEILSDTDEESAYRRVRQLKLAYVLAAPSELLGTAPGPDALLARLLRRDSFGRFRPLFVSEERRPGGGRFATVFEVVEGAVLTGVVPVGAEVKASLGDGYERTAAADREGAFRIRVSRPGVYSISAAGRAAIVAVSEEQIRAGARVSVGDPRSAPPRG